MDRLPPDLRQNLESYLNENEEILDAVKEVFVLRFDFRWIILTNQRIIVSIKRFLDYSFKDFQCRLLDVDLNLGFVFDEIKFSVPGKNYKSQFFSWNRDHTLAFFNRSKVCISGQEIKKSSSEETDLNNPIALLRGASKLLEDGIITKEEYEKKKKEILKRI